MIKPDGTPERRRPGLASLTTVLMDPASLMGLPSRRSYCSDNWDIRSSAASDTSVSYWASESAADLD